MGSQEPSTPRRRLAVVVAVVLAVAAVVVGVSALSLAGPEPAATSTAPGRATAVDDTVDLDLGPVTDADVSACAAGGFATDPATVEILYGVRQRSAEGAVPALLLRNASGALRFCDVVGPDSPAQLPLPEASADEPVVFLTNGRKTWDCTGGTLDHHTATSWLAVGPGIATVQERFWQGSDPGPWFSTDVVGGYAHLQTWLTGPVAPHIELGVQTRVLDAAGRPVAQATLSRGRVPLAGCADGDVQLG